MLKTLRRKLSNLHLTSLVVSDSPSAPKPSAITPVVKSKPADAANAPLESKDAAVDIDIEGGRGGPATPAQLSLWQEAELRSAAAVSAAV